MSRSGFCTAALVRLIASAAIGASGPFVYPDTIR